MREPSADIDLPKILIWGWRKQNSIYEDEESGSREVLTSMMGEYSGELSAHRVGTLFWIFVQVHPFLPRHEKVTRRRGKGVTPSPMHPRIYAQKGKMATCRVRAKSQFL